MVTREATNNSMCASTLFSVNSSDCYVFPSYLISFSLSINLILGFPANCYVLWLSVKEMIRGRSTEIFVVNGSLAEVIFCTSYVFVIRQYLFNCTNCRFGVYFPGVLLLVGRPLFHSCICVERYLGVVHPLTFLKLKPMKYRIACCAVGWIVIIISSFIVTLRVVEFHDFMLPHLLIFFSVKLYSCLMVLNALMRPGPSDTGKQKDAVNRDKIKAFWIILTVLVSSVIMYGPLIVLVCFLVFWHHDRVCASGSLPQTSRKTAGLLKRFFHLIDLSKYGHLLYIFNGIYRKPFNDISQKHILSPK